MDDSRSTERLFEVIGELAVLISRQLAPEYVVRPSDSGEASINAGLIALAAAELRRRGDTLVRGNDLALVLKYAGADPRLISRAVGDDILAAITRLETAVG